MGRNWKRTRMSALNNLSKCAGFRVMRSLIPGESGPAADTGSAVGHAIELWHRHCADGDETGPAVEKAIGTMRRVAKQRYPLANLEKAATRCLMYASDPRNLPGGDFGDVIADYCEATVTLEHNGFEFVGHVDQIRRLGGTLYVWDLKNGAPEGIDMLWSYAWQLAGYALAATETFGEPVLPGGIVRLAGYDVKQRNRQPKPHGTHSVFFEAPWNLKQCANMLDQATYLIEQIENGRAIQTPGSHCEWCPAGGAHLCGDKLSKHFQSPVTKE